MLFSVTLCLAFLYSKAHCSPQVYWPVLDPYYNHTVNASDFQRAEQCYQEWKTSSEPEDAHDYTTYPPETVTKIFETIQKVGNGSITTDCDGIPRFQWHASPTAEITRSVTVTSVLPEWTKRTLKKGFGPNCTYWNNEDFCARRREQQALFGTSPDSFGPDVKNGFEGDSGPCGYNMKLCQIHMRNEVLLIYWPPAPDPFGDSCGSNFTHQPLKAFPEPDVPRTIIRSAITFNGQDLYFRGFVPKSTLNHNWRHTDDTSSTSSNLYIISSVLSGPFTFVSPTVYLAYHPITISHFQNIFATDLLPKKDTIRSAGIIPLSSSDIHSIRPVGASLRGSNYAQLVASGLYSEVPGPDEHKPFDFRNLRNPVPASVYYDARSIDCWGQQTHCGTITDDSYRPQLAIRNRALSSFLPEWFECFHEGFDDPPIALYPIDEAEDQVPALETPIVPILLPTVAAQPGNSFSRDLSEAVKPTASIRAGHGHDPRPHPRPRPGVFSLGIIPDFAPASDFGGGDGPRITPAPRVGGQIGQGAYNSRINGQFGALNVNPQFAGPDGRVESKPSGPFQPGQSGRDFRVSSAGQIRGPGVITEVVGKDGRSGTAPPVLYTGAANGIILPPFFRILAGLILLI